MAAYRVHENSITGSRIHELMAESDSVRAQYGLSDYSGITTSVLRAGYWSRYKLISGWYKAKHLIARTERVTGFE
jgi:hypothetical protein